jgi:hypothetical protein
MLPKAGGKHCNHHQPPTFHSLLLRHLSPPSRDHKTNSDPKGGGHVFFQYSACQPKEFLECRTSSPAESMQPRSRRIRNIYLLFTLSAKDEPLPTNQQARTSHSVTQSLFSAERPCWIRRLGDLVCIVVECRVENYLVGSGYRPRHNPVEIVERGPSTNRSIYLLHHWCMLALSVAIRLRRLARYQRFAEVGDGIITY